MNKINENEIGNQKGFVNKLHIIQVHISDGWLENTINKISMHKPCYSGLKYNQVEEISYIFHMLSSFLCTK